MDPTSVSSQKYIEDPASPAVAAAVFPQQFTVELCTSRKLVSTRGLVENEADPGPVSRLPGTSSMRLLPRSEVPVVHLQVAEARLQASQPR